MGTKLVCLISSMCALMWTLFIIAWSIMYHQRQWGLILLGCSIGLLCVIPGLACTFGKSKNEDWGSSSGSEYEP